MQSNGRVVTWARGGKSAPEPHIIPPNLCGQGDHSVGAIGAWGIETLTIALAASI